MKPIPRRVPGAPAPTPRAGARAGLGVALLLCAAVGSAGDSSRSILFVGNSFTYADESPVQWYAAATVRDLNGEERGGVPALFQAFTEQVGQHYEVSLEAVGGASLRDHLEEQRELLDAPWDVVVMQDYSTLDPDQPGNSGAHVQSSGQLASLFLHRNARAEIHVVAVWPRADQIYRKSGHWYGKPIDQVARELRAAGDRARNAATPAILSCIPVGEAWTRAMKQGLADPNPYDAPQGDGIDLWARDHYHGSTYGYYLSALTIFGAITQCDPRSLGPREPAAKVLGIPAATVAALQRVASAQLVETPLHLHDCARAPPGKPVQR